MPNLPGHTDGYPERPGLLVGRAPRRGGPSNGGVVALAIGLVIGGIAWFLVSRAGFDTVLALAGMIVVGTIVSYFAWRNLVVLVCIWLFSMSGFRAFFLLPMPLMPDLSLERVITIWLVILFAFRLIMRRDTLRGPWLLDVVLLLHTLYIAANVMYIGHRESLHHWALSSLSPLIGYMLGKQITSRDSDVRFVYLFLFVVMIYYFVQSIAQKFSLNFLIWPPGILDLYQGAWPYGRSRGPFLHPPLFGQVMAMVLPFQFYLYFRMRSVAGRAWVLLAIVLGVFGLLYTYTRAPWIAAAAGLLTLGLLRPGYRQLLGGMGLVVVITAALGLLQLAGSDLLAERVSNTASISSRLAAFSGALRMWLDHPLFGIGWFNWHDVYPDYIRGEEIPFYGYISRHIARYAVIHDMYLGRLAEEGIVSIVLLTAALLLFWRRFRQLWGQVHESDWLNRDGLATIAAVFVVYAVGGAAIDFRYFDLVNVIPYFLGGIMMGYRVSAHPPPPDPYPNWTPPSFRTELDQE